MRLRHGLLTAVAVLGVTVVGAVPPATGASTAGVGEPGSAVAGQRLRADFFVSPDGNDSWSGKRPAPIGDSTDGPFATLDRAREAVRAARADDRRRGYVVMLRGGTYRMSEPVEFGPADSGTAKAPVSYVAAPGERPVLSGGRRVDGWRPHDPENGIWRARVGTEVRSRQLYVDGVRAIRARGERFPEGFEPTETGYAIDDPALSELRQQRRIEVTSLTAFKHGRCPIERIEPDRIVMRQPCWRNAHLGPDISPSLGQPRWLENAYEFLDEPREWYHDQRTGWLYYRPGRGEDLAEARVTMPVLSELIRGRGDSGRPVRHLVFRGLTFADTTWLRPSEPAGYPSLQAGAYISGEQNETYHGALLHEGGIVPAAVRFSGARHVSFDRNTFTRLGGSGLGIELGSQRNTISGNSVYDVSGAGITIGGISQRDQRPEREELLVADNVVHDNVVRHIGVEYQASVGIFAGWTSGTTIRNNVLYSLPYSGISVGWGWGYYEQDELWPEHTQYERWLDLVDRGVMPPTYDRPTSLRESTIANNHVFDYMTVLTDGGAVYTLSAQPDSVIRGNYFHTAHDNGGVGGNGVYLDEGSRHYDISDNVVCDIENRRWLLLHSTRDLTVRRTYADTPDHTDHGGLDNSVRDPVIVDGALPREAAEIVDRAGLRPRYADLLPDDAPEHDPAVVCAAP